MPTEQVPSGHTGTPHVRTGPELSDLALFVVAAVAVWFVPPRVAPPVPRGGLTPPPACATPRVVTDDPLARLEAVIQSRRSAAPDGSYTAQLFARGRARIAQKLGEEAVETVIAALGPDPARIVPEAADLLYHLLVLLADAGLSYDDVKTELIRREGISGLAEKESRPA